jgi:c-di-GMP-binding flagellar brake protein YcgR
MFRKRPPSVAKTDAPSTQQPSKRRFFRAAVSVPAQYQVIGRMGTRNATICDMSGGGVRIEVDEDIQPGAMIEVRFSLGNEAAKRRARGKTVLSFYDAAKRKFAHGIAFTGIEAADQEAIVQYITELQRERLKNRTV